MGKASNKLNPSKIKHPNCRKAHQFMRFKHKEATREKKKLTQFMKLNVVGEKMLWFRDNLDPEIEEYSSPMVAAMIEKYLRRFDDEMAVINNVKPYEKLKYASRKDQIRHTIKDEIQEYISCGVEVPDILNKVHLAALRKWNGELRYLQNITIVRYNKKQLDADSVNS